MNDSFQPQSYSTISIDDLVVDISKDLTFNLNNIISNASITSRSYSSDTYTIQSPVDYNFNWGDAEEFVDSFPSWQRVQDMCKKYPGLEVALQNFRTMYTLIKDDYDSPKDEK
jgi:phosphoenolpyruvate carboxylase